MVDGQYDEQKEKEKKELKETLAAVR